MLLTPLQSAKGLDPEQLLGTALPPCVRAFVFLATENRALAHIARRRVKRPVELVLTPSSHAAQP
jgi:hypothetical protein